METPTWLKPAILGGIVGAIATVFVGFNQGGWMLGGSAERMAQQRSVAAVTQASFRSALVNRKPIQRQRQS